MRPLLVVLCMWVALCMSAISAIAAEFSCEDWNTGRFFQRANVANISRCLKTKKPNARNKEGWTPLHYSARYSKSAAVVALVIKAGTKMNVRDSSGRTPLHYAARDNKIPEIVTTLIKGGAKVNIRDENGATPLHLAAGDSKAQALILARLEAMIAVLKAENERLKAKTNPKKQNKKQSTTSNRATKYSKAPAVVEALLKAGAKIDLRDKDGWTPLHYAAAKSEAPAVLTTLLKAWSNLSARDNSGSTPLHIATRFSKTPEVVTTLLDAGANPAAIDRKGRTPWDYAKQNAAIKGTDVYWRLNEERFKTPVKREKRVGGETSTF